MRLGCGGALLERMKLRPTSDPTPSGEGKIGDVRLWIHCEAVVSTVAWKDGSVPGLSMFTTRQPSQGKSMRGLPGSLLLLLIAGTVVLWFLSFQRSEVASEADVPPRSEATVESRKGTFMPEEPERSIAGTVDAGSKATHGTAMRGGSPEDAIPERWLRSLASLHGIAEFRGRRAEDLRVELFGPCDQRVLRVTTQADGSFAFGRLCPGSSVVLWFDRGGPLATMKEAAVPRMRGADLDLGVVMLEGGGTITGRLVDNLGTPVEGALIRAFCEEELSGGLETLPTGVVLGVWRARADRPWIATRREYDEESQASRGRPWARSTSDGTFTLSGALREDDVLRIEHPDHGVATVGPFQVSPEYSTPAGDVVLPEARRRIRGRVLDAAGRPVRGAEVFGGGMKKGWFLDPGDPNVDLDAAFWRVVSGAQGDATTTVAEGRLRFQTTTDDAGRFCFADPGDVEAVGALTSDRTAWVVVHPVALDGNVELLLRESREILLEIADEQGRPVADASAQAVPVCADGDVARFTSLAELRRGVVVAPGHLAIRGLPPCTYLVLVNSDSCARTCVAVDVTSESASRCVTLEAGIPLALRVVDGSGLPFADVEVVAILEQASSGFVRRTLSELLLSGSLDRQGRTDADGRVRFGGLERGNYAVLIDHPGCAATRVVCTVPANGKEQEVKLSLGGRIVGRPLDSTDLLPEVRSIVVSGPESYRGQSITTDRRGAFALDALPAGHYRLALMEECNGWSKVQRGFTGGMRRWGNEIDAVETDVVDGETSIVSFPSLSALAIPEGRVRGRVLVNGQPAAGWKIVLDAHDGGMHDVATVTDAEGRFEYLRLPPGRAMVAVPQPDGPTTVFPFPLAAKEFFLREGTSEQVEFSILIGRVRGRVVDAEDGRPVAGAKVLLRCEAAEAAKDPDIENVATAVTDKNGDFRIDPIVAGRHRLEVEREGYMWQAHTEPVVVPSGGEPPALTVRLGHGVIVRGRVEMPPEKDLPRLWRVELYDRRMDDDPPETQPNHRMWNHAEVAEDGSFALTCVIPGDYHARVTLHAGEGPREYEADPIPVTVPFAGLDGLVLPPTFRLKPERFPFSGRIELPAGVPRLVTDLCLRPTDAKQDDICVRVRSADFGFDGRVPAGTYVLHVLPHWNAVAPLEVTIPIGGLKLDRLVLQPATKKQEN